MFCTCCLLSQRDMIMSHEHKFPGVEATTQDMKVNNGPRKGVFWNCQGNITYNILEIECCLFDYFSGVVCAVWNDVMGSLLKRSRCTPVLPAFPVLVEWTSYTSKPNLGWYKSNSYLFFVPCFMFFFFFRGVIWVLHITDVNAEHPQCPLGCPVNLSHPRSLSPQEQLRSCEKPGGMGRSLGTRQRFSGTCASDGVDFCFFWGGRNGGTPCLGVQSNKMCVLL